MQVAFTDAALAQVCITRRAHKHFPRRVERGANTAHSRAARRRTFLYNYGVGSDLASHTLDHEAMDGWQVCRRRNPYPHYVSFAASGTGCDVWTVGRASSASASRAPRTP